MEKSSRSGSGLLGTLFGLFLVGFIIGKIMSPDWSDRITVMKSMAANIKVQKSEYGPVLVAACGIEKFGYVVNQDRVVHTVDTDRLADESIRHRGGFDEYEALGGLLFGSAVSESGAINRIGGLTRNQRGKTKATGIAAMVAFVGLGFFVGYDGEPDCNAAKATYQEAAIWRSFARSRGLSPSKQARGNRRRPAQQAYPPAYGGRGQPATTGYNGYSQGYRADPYQNRGWQPPTDTVVGWQ